MPAETMASASVLHAAHAEIGEECKKVNAAFMACKNANANPAACLAQGDDVTQCALSL